MSRFFTSSTIRAVIYPLLGACGAILAMVWPLGYKAFCAGLGGVVI